MGLAHGPWVSPWPAASLQPQGLVKRLNAPVLGEGCGAPPQLVPKHSVFLRRSALAVFLLLREQAAPSWNTSP